MPMDAINGLVHSPSQSNAHRFTLLWTRVSDLVAVYFAAFGNEQELQAWANHNSILNLLTAGL